jgi:large subunit ribosomal protein L9
MKVILIQDVKGLGKKDAAVEVNDGYARNFLLPRGLALEANATNMNLLNNKKSSEARKKDQEIAVAKELCEKINSIELIIKTKTGENGRLFGSITSKDVGEKLKASHGIDIDKKKIELSETIKTVGLYSLDVKLYTGISAKLKVKVEA